MWIIGCIDWLLDLDKSWKFWLAVALTLLLGSCSVSCYSCSNKYGESYTVVATVTDKQVKRYDDEDKYLIYTITDGGETAVFEVVDALMNSVFDSSDRYAGIQEGETYEFTVKGDRNEVLSLYPNIYEYRTLEEIKASEQAERLPFPEDVLRVEEILN